MLIEKALNSNKNVFAFCLLRHWAIRIELPRYLKRFDFKYLGFEKTNSSNIQEIN